MFCSIILSKFLQQVHTSLLMKPHRGVNERAPMQIVLQSGVPRTHIFNAQTIGCPEPEANSFAERRILCPPFQCPYHREREESQGNSFAERCTLYPPFSIRCIRCALPRESVFKVVYPCIRCTHRFQYDYLLGQKSVTSDRGAYSPSPMNSAPGNRL